MKKTVCYIAGAITNNPTYQYDFCDAEMVLKERGMIVLSPAWMPIGLHEYEDYMKIGKAMLEASDAVVFLEGWEKSNGAKIEHKLAKELGKKISYYKKGLVLSW